ncbi:MAG: OmpA family protein [Bacteroidetes bacterium]|nr:OmpA family protein [Bacteroidota bacterium]
MSKHYKIHHEEGEKHWQVSYIDLLTALLAAFVLLLGMSVPDQSKLDSFASSKNKNQVSLSTLSDELKQTIESSPALKGQISVVMTEEGIELRFGSSMLFQPGEAILKLEGYDAIYRIGQILAYFVKARNAYLAVEGHTDDTRLRSKEKFFSNWELSSARATEVLHFLEDTVLIEGQRLSSTGFADSRPVNRESDPATGMYTDFARNENRRVVIRIYYSRAT